MSTQTYEPKNILKNYNLINILGRGKYGKVYRAILNKNQFPEKTQSNNETFAIKKIKMLYVTFKS